MSASCLDSWKSSAARAATPVMCASGRATMQLNAGVADFRLSKWPLGSMGAWKACGRSRPAALADGPRHGGPARGGRIGRWTACADLGAGRAAAPWRWRWRRRVGVAVADPGISAYRERRATRLPSRRLPRPAGRTLLRVRIPQVEEVQLSRCSAAPLALPRAPGLAGGVRQARNPRLRSERHLRKRKPAFLYRGRGASRSGRRWCSTAAAVSCRSGAQPAQP